MSVKISREYRRRYNVEFTFENRFREITQMEFTIDNVFDDLRINGCIFELDTFEKIALNLQNREYEDHEFLFCDGRVPYIGCEKHQGHDSYYPINSGSSVVVFNEDDRESLVNVFMAVHAFVPTIMNDEDDTPAVLFEYPGTILM